MVHRTRLEPHSPGKHWVCEFRRQVSRATLSARRLINTSGLFRSRDDAKGPATLIIRDVAAREAAPALSDPGDLATPGCQAVG
jgi:hypothetical protein